MVFERIVTGHSKAPAEGEVAFVAKCTVGCVITFNHDQGESLPPSLLRSLATPLFFVASERCRNLVVGMGFPAPPLGALPELNVAKPEENKVALKSSRKSVQSATKPKKPRVAKQ